MSAFDALKSGGGNWFAWTSQGRTFKIDGEEVDIKRFLVDPTHIKTGWGKIQEGAPPEYVWADIPGTKIKCPGEGFKAAFEIMVYCAEEDGAPGDGWRPWATNAAASREAVTPIWASIETGGKENKGKVVEVEVTGSKSLKLGKATVNVPQLTLCNWVDRPDDAASQDDAPQGEPDEIPF
jgi:hypothetical protein